MKRSAEYVLCVLALVGLFGCGSSKKEARLPLPDSPSTTVATATSQLSEADQAMETARQHYFVGERELNLGHLEKAKTEFDASLDVLMTYQSSHDPDPGVETLIDELENKIFQHEVAALQEGDGFTERPLEPALIDELKNIDTFPLPDQATKSEVEEELKTATYDVPVEVNDTVLSFIRIFQNSRRKEFVGGLVRSGRYLPIMRQIFREEGVPEDLVYTALIESSFKSNAYSHARAKGFWQFISGTAKRYDLKMDWWVDERSDFEKSTRAAARYLKDLHAMFGDWYLALAGYNAGENKVLYGLNHSTATNFWQLSATRYLRQETKNYVPAILAAMIIAKDPVKHGFEEVLDPPIQFDRVAVDAPVDLRLIAECTGASLEEVKLLNPELTRLTTPARASSYELRVPVGKQEQFLAEIATIPPDKRVTWRKHEVKPGETLTSIASIYRTSAGSIAQVNSFDSGAVLSVGQRLVIPIGRSAYTPPSSTRYASGSGTRTYYTVRQGDTLFRIATRNGTSVDRLCELNGISSGDSLRIGQKLVVRYSEPRPAPVKVASATKPSAPSQGNRRIVYRVKPGDTLFQIASNYKTDVDSIKKWNNLRSQRIYPGDHLTIYTK